MPLVPLAAPLLAALLVLTPDDADERARYIDGLHARQLHELIVDEAATFLGEHPRHQRADMVRYRLASALFDLDRLDEARPHFATLTERRDFAQRAEVHLRLGQCALAAGDHGDAAGALQVVLTADAEYLRTPATFLLAEARFRAGDFAAAEPGYAAVLERDPQGPYAADAATGRVWCALRTGDHAAALGRAEQALADRPDAERRRELSFLQGEALAALDRPVEALTALARVDGGPYAGAALRSSAFAHAALGAHDDAAAAFERLRDAEPEGPFAAEAAFQAGVHHLQAGDADRAWSALADRRVPDTAESAYWRGRARAAQGRTDEALTLLDRAASLGPSAELAGPLAAAKGELLLRSGRSAEAADAFERGGSPEALHAAAVSRLNAGDAAGALELVERLLTGGARDPALARTRGEALFALERWAEAEQALAEAPADARRDSRLAWCRYQQGDLSSAAERFARLAEQHPEAPQAAEALHMAGRCHDELGQPEAARQQWQRYLQRHDDGPHAADAHLGLAELAEGRDRAEHLLAVLQLDGGGERTPRALLALADDLSAAGEHGQAAQLYRRLLEQHGDHATAWPARYGLGWSLVEGGDPTGAAAALEPLVARPDPRRRQPTPPAELALAGLELLVWCHHEAGQPEQAAAAADELAARDAPAQALLEAGRTVAAARVAAGDHDQALSGLAELARRPGLTAPALVEAAWIALDAERLDQAVPLASGALQANADGRDGAEVAFFVAEACFEAGRDAEALPLYAGAADAAASPVADDALYKAGFTHLRADDPAAALPCFARLVAEHEGSELLGESLFLAGEACFRQDDFAAAAPWLERLLDEQPGHAVAPKARFRLGLSLAQLERFAEAERVLADLARLTPAFDQRLEAELWRGRALAAQGKDRPARSAFTRVVAEDQGQLAARARIGLGQLSLDAGRTDEALSEFLKVAVLYAHAEEVAQALVLAGDCLAAQGRADQAAERWREVLSDHGETAWAAEARRRLQPR